MPLVIFVLLFTCSSDAFFDGVRDKYNNGFPESKYHQILNTFETIYGKKIQDLGGEFVIWRDWSDGAVNMWAEKWGAQYILEVPGGMARYHLISEEAFVLSVCHELGHLLGGEPKNGEISFEGQSDYFAGGQCIEEMLNSIPPIKGLLEDPDVLDFCRGLEAVENSLCQRVVSGAKSLSSYYAEILGVPFPQVTLSSGKKVSQTLNSHPEPQCRLDTFLAGFRQVPRPQCWYAGRFFFSISNKNPIQPYFFALKIPNENQMIFKGAQNEDPYFIGHFCFTHPFLYKEKPRIPPAGKCLEGF